MFKAAKKKEYLGKTFLEMGFLSSIAKMFEVKKQVNKNTMVS